MATRDDLTGRDQETPTWLAKYRPMSLDQMALPADVRTLVTGYLARRLLPNLFLPGSPGIGKSTLARIVTEQLPCSVFVLDASRDRGVSTIRETIFTFGRCYPWPGTDMQVVVCEEADGLTPDAQLALRNVMDRVPQTTRFLFTVNHAARVIEPLQVPVRDARPLHHSRRRACPDSLSRARRGVDPL
jgi:replication factor C small subunit